MRPFVRPRAKHRGPHDGRCDLVATIVCLEDDGAVVLWGVGAACGDSEETVYRHFRAWAPGATWLGVTFEPARDA